MERAPDQLISLAVIVPDLASLPDAIRAAAPEEEGFRDDVGRVEAADAEGDDVVEGGGGADVDEADGAGDEGGDEDGEEGDGVFGLDLWGFTVNEHISISWEKDVPC